MLTQLNKKSEPKRGLGRDIRMRKDAPLAGRAAGLIYVKGRGITPLEHYNITIFDCTFPMGCAFTTNGKYVHVWIAIPPQEVTREIARAFRKVGFDAKQTLPRYPILVCYELAVDGLKEHIVPPAGIRAGFENEWDWGSIFQVNEAFLNAVKKRMQDRGIPVTAITMRPPD